MQEEPMFDDESREEISSAAEGQLPSLPRLLSAHYDSFLAVAEQLYAREAPGNSVSPRSLVHEAFLRLVKQPKVTTRGSVFFRSCFSKECRHILVDRARRRGALKRGGNRKRESLADQEELGIGSNLDVLELNDALEKLATADPVLMKLVEIRIFGGLTVPECATVLGVSSRTVDTKWSFAIAWLRRELGAEPDH